MLNLADLETLILVTKVADAYGVDPLSSIEAEVFFNNILSTYNEPVDQTRFINWLNIQLSTNFVVVGERPRWIQARDWQFADGIPMIYAGQIDITKKSFSFYHDDTSLYVFIGKNVQPKVIIQQY